MHFLKRSKSKSYIWWLGLLMLLGFVVTGVLIYRVTEAYDYFERKYPDTTNSLP